MYLKQLKLANFKNYTEVDFNFSAKINCFIGNNGVGKTNVLDAIYYLSFCKSYFNSVDAQNINHNEEFFAIHGLYDRSGDKRDQISCQLKRNHKKKFKKNKKEYDRLADHIGVYPLVMISPYDRDLINDGSELRRKFIDSVISQFDKLYLNNLINYNKVVTQRNALLKQFAERNFFDYSSLEIWDDKMIELGKEIYKKRVSFLKDFEPIFKHYFDFISDGSEEVSIEYFSKLEDNDFSALLKESLNKDRAVRYSTVGVHKDDLVFKIGDYPIKKFGSQGQQKSFVIAIKLAQFEYTRKIKGFKPILLFDDIFDKLDNNRVEKLIMLVSKNSFGQVFITDTQKERIEYLFKELDIDHKIFEISEGNVKEIVE
ncbi:MAG: DNA replication/repair protein RecF [Bacteroidota bacterium]|nr:DNA replication/repair protein RecF [Bacteroidota bacterium]